MTVTWSEGNTYGSPITKYIIQTTDNWVGDTWTDSAEVTAVDGLSSYSAVISIGEYVSYVVRVAAYNDLGVSGPAWYQYLTNHDVTSVVATHDFISGAQRCIPVCADGLEECSEDDPWYILARGLPYAPVLEIPGYPDVDTARFFSKNKASVYYYVPTVNGNNVDKYRVQWDVNNNFTSAEEFVLTDTTYEISGLTMGTKYYIRVTAHHTLGYGAASNVYPFWPHQQPDPPQNPTLSASTTATDMVTYATSLTAEWEYPLIEDPDLVGDGGDTVTGYVVEWSKADFSTLTPTVHTITLAVAPAAVTADMKFRLSMTTVNDRDQNHDGEYYYSGSSAVTGTYTSSDIYCDGDDATFKNALENMPNVAEVTVLQALSGNVQWSITFNEVYEVPVFVISDETASISGLVTIAITTNFAFSSSAVYKWMEIDASVSEVAKSFVMTNLLPGVAVSVLRMI